MSTGQTPGDEARAEAPPVIVLAFANDLEGKSYLRDLTEEARELKAVLQGAKDRGLCEFEHIANARFDDISKAFKRYGRRVVVFHFGGHAGPDCLHLETTIDGPRGADATSFA